jgi:hypothetical protein
MKLIKRDMNAEETARTAEHNRNEYLPYCQAGLNSDGVITLRNYDRANKSNDEIIILSKSETDALFALFRKIEQIEQSRLPY